MIVFNYERIEEFLVNLDKRIGNKIFTNYVEPGPNSDLAPNKHKLVVQFLGYPAVDNNSFQVLHQCRLFINSKKERDEVINQIKKSLEKVEGIHIVQGHISEIFISIS